MMSSQEVFTSGAGTKASKAPGSTVGAGAKPRAGGDSPKAGQSVPLERVLEGVSFALSGFKNPFRGELREKGVAMGALYQPDWTPSCTHLV